MEPLGVTAGSVITRVYYAIPEHGTIGRTSSSWNEIVGWAKREAFELDARLTDSLGAFATVERIRAIIETSVRIDLRWVIQVPGGPEIDMVVQSFHNVHQLRSTLDEDD